MATPSPRHRAPLPPLGQKLGEEAMKRKQDLRSKLEQDKKLQRHLTAANFIGSKIVSRENSSVNVLDINSETDRQKDSATRQQNHDDFSKHRTLSR